MISGVNGFRCQWLFSTIYHTGKTCNYIQINTSIDWVEETKQRVKEINSRLSTTENEHKEVERQFNNLMMYVLFRENKVFL